MFASIICRTTATVLALTAAASCVSPSPSIIPGPAYAQVMADMEAPIETRVFLANQHPASSFPGCVMIAKGGFTEMSARSQLEWARTEGAALKADFVIISRSTYGVDGVLGLIAMRLTPASFGYAQENGVVTSVTTDDARAAGLMVGDQILTINEAPFADRVQELMSIQPGDLVTFAVRRNGQALTIQFAAASNPPVHLELAEPVVSHRQAKAS